MTSPERALARIRLPRAVAALALVGVAICSACRDSKPLLASGQRGDAGASRPPAEAAVRPGPACAESDARPGAWPAAKDHARAVRGSGAMGHLEQRLARGDSAARLRFMGTHLFDLLDKLANEGGPTEDDRRRVICAALEEAAASGAPVVRIWGSLKRTGSPDEVARAADMLALVLDENARRARPLRFVIALVNHQPGYGAPRPEASLDDQDPTSPWSARRFYLEGGWRARGAGLLEDRVRAFAARPEIASSREVLAWELVNELDTHRSVAGGTWSGPEADALRDGFVVPAMELLAKAFPQPIAIGDLRGHVRGYEAFARSVILALPAPARDRLIWVSHVYAPRAASIAAPEIAEATRKLDMDLAIAKEHGLPFLLGEIGQTVRGAPARFCGEGVTHDLPQLFRAVLESAPGHESRGDIESAIFWGEGRCGLAIPWGAGSRRVTIGAGGDSADLAPGDGASRAALRALRGEARFTTALP